MEKLPDDRYKEIISLLLKIILYVIMVYLTIIKKETETVSVLMKITQILASTI